MLFLVVFRLFLVFNLGTLPCPLADVSTASSPDVSKTSKTPAKGRLRHHSKKGWLRWEWAAKKEIWRSLLNEVGDFCWEELLSTPIKVSTSSSPAEWWGVQGNSHPAQKRAESPKIPFYIKEGLCQTRAESEINFHGTEAFVQDSDVRRISDWPHSWHHLPWNKKLQNQPQKRDFLTS